MEVIFISGIFMSFFIVFLLLTKRNKVLTDRILATWVAIMGIHLLGYYLNQQGYWEKYPHLIGVTAPFPFLHGPLLYLYTLYSLRSDNKIRKVDYLHFLPVAFAYIYMFNFFFFYTAEEKRMVDRGEIPDYGLFTTLLLAGFLISGIIYAILSYRLTLKHKQKLKQNFSFNEGINLNWLQNCIWGIGIIFLSAVIIVVTRRLMGIEYSFNADYIFYTLIIIFIFYLGYNGIRHQDIFTDNMNARSSDIPEKGGEKYRKSGLKPEVAAEAHQKLLKYMEEERPWLNPKLSLTELAGLLGLSTNQLSQLINQYEKVNFHDFVNQFRVDEFIRRASKDKNFSYLAIAFDAGFNSKSSFNAVFKKHTGSTPSKYLADRV